MEKEIFYGNKDISKLYQLIYANKDQIIAMYQDAFGLESPYKEDRSNPDDVVSAISDPLKKGGVVIIGKVEKEIVGVTTVYPLLIDSGREDLVELLNQDFDIPMEAFMQGKVMYACDSFVDKNKQGKGIGSRLYGERLGVAKDLGFEYFVGTTSSETSNASAIAFHKKNGMNFSEKSYAIASAYSESLRYLMMQKL